MATVQGIEFVELENSPRIQISGKSGIRAERRFGVAWDRWLDFVLVLIGRYRATGSHVVLANPPHFPGLADRLFVSEISIEPFDGSSPDGSQVSSLTSGTNRYHLGGNFAVVTAEYISAHNERNDLPEVPRDTFLTYREDLGTEYLRLPGSQWKWSNDTPLSEEMTPGVLLPKGEITLTWHRVVRPPWLAIDALRGSVNGGPFLGRRPGTVLFLGAKITRAFELLENSGYWRVEYEFAVDSKLLNSGELAGWNYLYNEQAISGEHWQVPTDASDRPMYREADFTPLFFYG